MSDCKAEAARRLAAVRGDGALALEEACRHLEEANEAASRHVERATAAEARAEALLGYACHAETCEFNEYGEAWDCTCGLDNLRGGR